ncbi:sodium-dependent bicarbonate transport family permease [Roseomonas nepalensis]|uniref:Sodium-dependent bicarbonate transport family permease n=1 Tax=Muricoccus nepalensis TaxID=1854500 RepID=A0A502FAG9_9PROT|nr:sodium-dependent bicarbonate transport family permease [Roseomonas nepalensis]TPG46370.1 sodium-dependent bicarbonate transport family permease [Roseomonas nepalensis]
MIDLGASLLSPAVLCFVLGAAAHGLRSDLRLPDAMFSVLSAYLMLAIGLKGGAALAATPFAAFVGPAAGALALGCAIPVWTYALLRRLGGFSAADAAAVAAHYGSVSAVTFAAVIDGLGRAGVGFEGYAAALLALLEAPAILIALALGGLGGARGGAGHGGTEGALGRVLAEVATGKSVVLLVGGLAIGALVGPSGLGPVKPFFVDLFPGVLCLFLLDLGRVAAERARDFRAAGPWLALFAVLAPVVHGALGVLVAYGTGMSQGGAVVLGTLAASASYIAAPAAVRLALPEANPGLYLTASLAITFPFNIVFGIALYAAMARLVYG